jgi:hypothetical protein
VPKLHRYVPRFVRRLRRQPRRDFQLPLLCHQRHQCLPQSAGLGLQAWRNFGILWAFCIFNIVAALALYWLLRMPKTKKDKKDKKEVGAHKDAVKERALDEPSRVGSHTEEVGANKGEKETEAQYTSITGGDATPPRHEVSEKQF